MKKGAFTIAELVICIIIMFVIMGCAISIPFKKSKITQQVYKKTGYEICSCNDASTGECEIEILNPGQKREFFTVQILGGGAAGSASKGGAAGEVKILHYPALEGTYVVKLGHGGLPASLGDARNGGATVIYKKADNGALELFEFARGGIGSNENYNPDDSTMTPQEAAKGEDPAFGVDVSSPDATGSTLCGKGGDAGQNGNAGEVIIKW